MIRNSLILLSIAAMLSACAGRGEEAENCPDVGGEDDTAAVADDSGGGGGDDLEVVGQLWTLLEVPAWDEYMGDYVLDHEVEYCLRLSDNGVLDVWDDGGYHWTGDRAGTWSSSKGGSTFSVEWIRFSAGSPEDEPQGWTWVSDSMIVTDGTVWDADAIPVERGCPFTPAD